MITPNLRVDFSTVDEYLHGDAREAIDNDGYCISVLTVHYFMNRRAEKEGVLYFLSIFNVVLTREGDTLLASRI